MTESDLHSRLIVRNSASHPPTARLHSGAVCKEMGERLSLELGPQSNELPPHLLAFMEQLAKVDAPEDDAGGAATAD